MLGHKMLEPSAEFLVQHQTLYLSPKQCLRPERFLKTILKLERVRAQAVPWPENGEEGLGTLKSCIFKRRLEMKRWSRQIRRRTLPGLSGKGVAVSP